MAAATSTLADDEQSWLEEIMRRARDVMTSPVVTVSPRTSVKQAAGLLARHGFTTLPVLDDDGWLTGLVTEADIVSRRFPSAQPSRSSAATWVEEVMGRALVTVAAVTPLADVITTMIGSGTRALPVVQADRLVGIVTYRDLLQAVARDDADIADDVRRRLEIYGGSGRWQVAVHDSDVEIADVLDDTTDLGVATALAEDVPGVWRAHRAYSSDHDSA